MKSLSLALQFLILIGGLFLNLSSAQAEKSSNISTLKQARIVYADASEPPDFTHAAHVQLRHFWKKEGLYGNAWYEITFPLSEINEVTPWEIYLPNVNMNAEVWLNGAKIGSGGSLTPPISRQWHTPLSFVIPTILLRPENTVHIRVRAYANQFGGLGRVLIGPETDIRPLYKQDQFESNTLHAISGALALFFALILFPVWLKRREGLYFWFAFSCLMWGISSMNMYVHDIPVSEHVWERLMQMSLGWVPVSLAIFLVRLDNKQFPKLERIVLSIATLFNIVLIFTPIEQLFLIANSWHAYAISVGFFSILYLTWSWWKTRKREHAVILICIIIIALSGFYDLTIQLNWMGREGDRFLLNYTIPLVLVMIGYLMVNHFLNAIDESETLNRELESRVRKAQEHIETNYHRILALETEQAANNERERIYRDLHDDLGGKLLSMVYRSDSSKMANLARSALNDLREIVSHKPVIRKQLSDEINDWIQECRLHAEEAGKKISFKLINLNKSMGFRDEETQHIQRMLREAVTNAIKHNDDEKIRITMHYRLKCLKITVADGGDYGDVQQWTEGTGLNSLRYRCEQLGGKIRWHKNKEGGQVSWIIPMN